MGLWSMLGVVLIAGGVGGIANALMTENGFWLPRREAVAEASVVRPGIFGNILLGALAAVISWGLYGAYAGAVILGGPAAPPDSAPPGLTLSSLVGALLIGVGGSRWLTSEVDKRLLKASAIVAASRAPVSNMTGPLTAASPAETLRIVAGFPAVDPARPVGEACPNPASETPARPPGDRPPS